MADDPRPALFPRLVDGSQLKICLYPVLPAQFLAPLQHGDQHFILAGRRGHQTLQLLHREGQ